MKTISVVDARGQLCALVDLVAGNCEPILIIGKRNNAVLVSEGEWRSIQDTLHLLSIPGIRESIREGMEAPSDDTNEDPGW